MLRNLNLIPLLLIPAVATGYVIHEGIIETPWSTNRLTSETLPRPEVFELRSDETGSRYRIYVQLPHDYSKEDDPYPVLYVLQTRPSNRLFDDIFAPLLRRDRMPHCVIVNVTHVELRSRSAVAAMGRHLRGEPIHSWRDDLTHHTDPKDETEGGGAEAFTAFLEHTLIPRVEESFHVDPANRTVCGVGFAGLYGVDTAFRHPGLFHRVVAIAPRADFANYAAVNDLRQMTAAQTVDATARIYVGVGGDDYPVVIQAFEVLSDVLKQAAGPNMAVKSEMLRGRNGENGTIPAAREGLRFVFAD